MTLREALMRAAHKSNERASTQRTITDQCVGSGLNQKLDRADTLKPARLGKALQT
jgi:hypothetical protein